MAFCFCVKKKKQSATIQLDNTVTCLTRATWCFFFFKVFFWVLFMALVDRAVKHGERLGDWYDCNSSSAILHQKLLKNLMKLRRAHQCSFISWSWLKLTKSVQNWSHSLHMYHNDWAISAGCSRTNKNQFNFLFPVFIKSFSFTHF